LKNNSNERFFSVELQSLTDLKNVRLANDFQDKVFVEGNIGELVQAVFAEGIILEIAGKRGTLRINLNESEIKKPQLRGDF
jgi:hypothetical protein